MIRQPTPYAEAYGWWIVALAGGDPEVNEVPQCGFYKRRLVKHGPMVPARIWLDAWIDDADDLLGPETLQCEVNGAWADAEDQWPWLCQEPISEPEFRYMEALRAHAEIYEPAHPAANPRAALNHLTTPLHF